jgi:hypothetical protein
METALDVQTDEISGPVPSSIEKSIAIKNIDVLVGGCASAVRRSHGKFERIGSKIKGSKVPTLVKNRPSIIAIRNTVRFVGHSGTSEVVGWSNQTRALLTFAGSPGNP